MKEPTQEMLDYAKRHNLRHNPVGGAWCFYSTSGSVPFSMSYSEVEELAEQESEEKGEEEKP